MADKKGKPTANGNAKSSTKGLSNEQIIAKFNQLRQEQRALMSKIAELEGDQNEHRLVIETLKEVDGNRKCFRLVGGVLVERTVKDVAPALQHNKDQLGKLCEALTKQVESKGKEINEFREKHNIRVKGEQPANATEDSKEKASTQGVLVASGT